MVKYLEKMVSVRIVSVEYYMCCPVPDLDIIYSEFRNIEVRQVPVIQIFGSTESGEKACLNIHGVLPYLYIPYDGLEASGPLSYKIALELDKHINISLGQATSNTIHVHNVVLVSGTPMYGYHEKPHQFFKIYLYNPAIVKKACSLLENGSILGKCFQPHEVHINYILQFKIDYNLHGMSFINVSHVKYRHNPDYPEYLSDISADLILPKSLIRRTVSKLEMDALASDITNAEQVRNGIGVNPGITAIWNDERQRRREQNLDSQISYSLTQERVNKPIPTLSDRLYNKRLQDKLTQDSVVSDDKSILNNSVYPAETPDDIDICAASNTSVFDVTFLDETLTTECLDVFDQKDQNLLDILQELKESAHVEEDSILSQQTPAPIDAIDLSSDEEVEDLSNSLDQNIVKAIDDVVVNNNFDPWADSFWDDNVSVPQLDGIHDTDIGDSQSESTTNSQKSNSPRYANEVYVCNSPQIKIPSTMCLSVGSNTLILNKPKNDSTMSTKINILSDIPVRTKEGFYITHNIDDIDQEPPAIENYTPLCIDDGDYRSLKNQEDLNNVLVHDVNMGISLLDESCQLKDNAGSSKMTCYSTREENEVLDYEYSSGNETFNEKENINENITKQGTHNCGNASNHRTIRKLNTSKNHRSQSEDSHLNNNNSCDFNDSYISNRLSDTNINLTIRNLSAKIKNRLCNRNLDGADDTPTSGSNSSTEDNKSCEEKQQKKRVKHSPSPSRKKPSKNRNKSKCRISGLVKLSAKGTKNKSKKKHVAPSEKEAIVKEPFLPFDEDSMESIFPSAKSAIISQAACKIPEEEILQIIEPTISSSEGNVKKTRQKSEKSAPLKKEATIGPENAKKRKRSARKIDFNVNKEDTTNITLDIPSASENKGQIVPSIKIVRKYSRSEKIKTQSDSSLHDEDIETSSLSDYVILQNTDNIANDSVSKINLHIVPAPVKKPIRPKKRSKKIKSDSSVLEVVKVNPEISTNYSDVNSKEINCTSENPARSFKKLVKKTKKVSNQSKKESSAFKIFSEVSASSAENSVFENKDLVLKKSVKNFNRTKKESKEDTCKIAPLKTCREVSASNSNYSVTDNKINDLQQPVIKNYEDKNLPIPEITAATTSTITNPTDCESNLEASSKETFYSVNQELVTKSDRPNKVIIVSEIIPSDATIEKSSVGVPASNSEVSSKEKNQNLQQFVKKSRPSSGVKVKTSSGTSVQINGNPKLQEFVKKFDQSAITLSKITVPISSVDSILEAPEAISNVPVKENNSQVFKKLGRPKKTESLFSNISVERSSVDCIIEAVINSDDAAKANLQRSVKKYGQPKKSAVIETLPENSNSEVSEKKSLFLKQPVIKLTRCQKKPIAEITSNSENSTEANATQIIDDLPVNKYASEKTEVAVEICSKYANTEIPQFSNNLEDSKIENVTQILQSPVRTRGWAKKLLIPSEAEFSAREKKPIAEISNSDNSTETNATQIIDDLSVSKYASEKTEVAVEICSKYANTEIPQFSNNLEDSKIENVTQILQSPVRKRGRAKKLLILSEAEFSGCQKKPIAEITSNSKNSTEANATQIIDDLPVNKYASKKTEVAVEICSKYVNTEIPQFSNNSGDSKIENVTQILQSPIRKRGRSKKLPISSEAEFSENVSKQIPTNLHSEFAVGSNTKEGEIEQKVQIFHSPVRKRGRSKKSSAESQPKSDHCETAIVVPDISLANVVDDNVILSTFDDMSQIIELNKPVRRRGKPKKSSKQSAQSNSVNVRIKSPPVDDKAITAYNLPENVVDASFEDTTHLVKKLSRSKKPPYIPIEPSLLEVKDKIDLPIKPEIADYLNKLNMTETNALEQLQNINVKIEDSSLAIDKLNNASKVHIAKKLCEEIKVNNSDMKSNKYADFKKMPKDTGDTGISKKASSKRFRKKISLQLKKSEGTENLENTISPVLKDLRVNLTRVDDLVDKHNKLKELRVVLERLNMEKILAEKLKTTASANVEQPSAKVKKSKSNRIKTASSIEQSFDSYEDITEPPIDQKKKLLSSPKRNAGKKNKSALKYSPLPVVIRSPTKQVTDQSPKKTIAVNSPKKRIILEKPRAKLSSRNSVLTTENLKKEDSATETKVPGIGEFLALSLEKRHASEETEDHAGTLNQAIKDKPLNNCDTRNQMNTVISSTNAASIKVTHDKTLAINSIKKNLFSQKKTQCNDDFVERNSTTWKQSEENFLDEIDVAAGMSKDKPKDYLFFANKYNSEGNNWTSPTKIDFNTVDNINFKYSNRTSARKASISESTNTENVIFKTPEKKSIITSADYLDYSPFGSSYDTPQKQTQSNDLVFTPRETLSQKCERELYDNNYYFTKTDNLTVAEKYDLERNFAPQPGCSNVPDLVINKQDELVHSNHTQTSTESFRNAFNFSQYVASQNLSILDESIIQSDSKSRIWMPKFNPPTVRDIKNTMEDYNIPKHRFQFPFYSDHKDVTKKVDVGSNVLKIPSKSVSELEEFCSSVNYEGLEQWRKAKFQNACPDAEISNKSNLRVTLSSNSEFIMTPVKPPPSKKFVMKWLETRNDINKQELSDKAQKIKIRIPRSPGHDNDSGDDSIIVSPCTPDIANRSPTSQTTESNTALSLTSSQTFIHKKVRRKGLMQRKKLFHYSQPKSKKTSCNSNNSCEITGISLDNTHGFKLSYENLQHAKAITEHQYLTVLVMEMHIRTRGELYPDPQYDAIRAIFYSITNDVPENSALPTKETGILLINSLPISPTKDFQPLLEGSGIKCEVVYLNSELDLIDSLIKLIKKWDPDIVTGFEIEMQSWGYFIERCYVLGIDVLSQISRMNPALLKNKTINFEPSKEIKLHGRIVLDAWRLFRSEIALTSYTFENLMYHILHKRKPTHSFKDLSFWWDHKSNYYRHITAKYYIDRVEGIIELMDQLDLIGRTSELARLFGIQFYEVLSRGSQFRVESMMLRLAKPMNYIPVSPSVQQRAKMRAPEWIPLIFEPQSRFYADPVIVLDFQSLYPSIIIAYNYCYSTCVGKVEKLGTDQVFEFGACQLRLPKHKLKNIKDHLTFSPCGVGFVSAKVRQGILPRMLKEILETRLMVKASMKGNKENKILQRVLHSRQLGLKLIANVTYGYTAANFSGRMPCSEVGDSVVSKGRETLERAIKLIENTPKWRAKVVYGDTDSVFVLLEGRSREEAFKIGEEIAESVTNDNPPPVKLKLEKIYQPCILQTKKRYVGYMYESIDQRDPEYNAKGIETVRRDGCPAVAKMLEKSLRTLFETKDVSLVKRYVMRQFEKLISGRVSIQDLTFAREYRGAGGYRPGACVPALELARKWTAVDKRREPRRGERVPYIIVHGPPGVPLIKLARCPKELLGTDQSSQGLRPNAEYYITRVIIPALNRCFALIGANMHAWYNDMPRKQISTLPTDVHFEKSKKSTISQYFATMNCAVCGIQTTDGLCEKCCQNPQKALVTLNEKIWRWERNFTEVNKICESCCGRGEQIQCISLDCPVLYRLLQTSRDLKQVPFLRTLIDKF